MAIMQPQLKNICFHKLEFLFAELSNELAKLNKQIFGNNYERFVATKVPNNPDLQLSLDYDAATIVTCKIIETAKVIGWGK